VAVKRCCNEYHIKVITKYKGHMVKKCVNSVRKSGNLQVSLPRREKGLWPLMMTRRSPGEEARRRIACKNIQEPKKQSGYCN
jgi:hypothetical protein